MTRRTLRALLALLPCLAGLAGTPGCGKLYVDPILGSMATDGALGGPGGVLLQAKPVDKVDLLFMIDNSMSMGDKQAIFIAAVPDLIQGLVQPNCLDEGSGVALTKCLPDAMGNCSCAAGTLEFPPVHDMHIGIVTSSLGGRGSDACPEPTPNPINPGVDTHNNDNGELINRSDPMNTQSETAVADAAGDNFLAWFPPVAANMGATAPTQPAITASVQLITDFSDLVSGVHQYGCGFEAQDEAWYRFLVQPDPYDHVSRDTGECAYPASAPTGQFGNTACLVGVDGKILQQRADFLRPDSLLAVIVLTDENSGEVVDPLAIGGQAWAYMDSHFPGGPGQAAMGTTACGPTPIMGVNPGPLSPKCTSCGFANDPNVIADKAAGGNCAQNGGYYLPTQDDLNTRGVYDKQRFGVDPRFPVQRYINGLSQTTVPDRTGEDQGGNYVGNANCTNPVFAASLPTDPTANLCTLALGPRAPSQVFLATIAGVPHELLQAIAGVDPECSPPNVPAGTAQADCPQKATLTAADWTKMLGNDPESYDFTGIDPHMFVSIGPRPGLPSPSSPGNGTDPVSGREWNTANADQQFACTFPLATPRDCSMQTAACDCTPGRCDACGTNPNCSCPPLCGPTSPTQQILAKAYPSPRELEEAKGLGSQGIVSSVCPIHTTDASGTDPLYGYRPAVSALIGRMKNALGQPCLPDALPADPSCGAAACALLETVGAGGTQADCGSGMYPGFTQPDPSVLAQFNAAQHASWVQAGGLTAGIGPDPSTLPTCQVTQLVPASNPPGPACATSHTQVEADFLGGTCAASAEAGWCYVQGAAAGTCPQAIVFSPGARPQAGAQIRLVCQ